MRNLDLRKWSTMTTSLVVCTPSNRSMPSDATRHLRAGETDRPIRSRSLFGNAQGLVTDGLLSYVAWG